MHTLETDAFDLVIDKACIDSLFCRSDYLIKVALMLREVQRVLKPGCHYFAVSMGQPSNRGTHLVRKFLSWERKEFILHDDSIGDLDESEGNTNHYVYTCKKRPDANVLS